MAEPVSDRQRARWREDAEEREWTYLQKGYLICMHLRDGEAMRTCDVADLMGVTWDNAYRAMVLLSVADPAIKQDERSLWYLDFEQLSC